MIAVHQLARHFGPVRALAGVDFELAPGELVGLIGPNGAGKTTLLRILATLCAPDRGTAVVAGFDCARDPESVRHSLGFVPENPPIIPEARVDEYLLYRATLQGVPKSKRAAAVDRVLEQSQLREVRKRLARHVSHGYRRRLSLAEALLNEPRVLLLDEPTVGLDPLQIRHTRDLLNTLAADRTILISTHLLADAEVMCRRVLMLFRGMLAGDVRLVDLATGTVEVEVQGPVETIRAWASGRAGPAEVRVLPDGWCRVSLRDSSAEDQRADVAADCLRHGWQLRELKSSRDSLEERLLRVALEKRAG